MKKLAAFFRNIFLISPQSESLPSTIPKDLTDSYRRQCDHLYLDQVTVALPYAPTIQRKLHNTKYRQAGDTGYFVSVLGDMIVDGESMIVFPPITWKNRVFRGKNHMKRIVFQMCDKGRIYEPFGRRGNTHQAGLDKKGRTKNAGASFYWKEKSPPPPEKVILIDDVISTGSTANELAKLLKKHGAKEVYGYFLTSSHKDLAKAQQTVQ